MPGRMSMPEHRAEAWKGALPLRRRGFDLGWVRQARRPAMPDEEEVVRAWRSDRAVLLPDIIPVANFQADIERAGELMRRSLSGESLADILEEAPYAERLHSLPLVAVSTEDHDAQGIEKLYFDAERDGQLAAEDLWCKVSWLSFVEDDASLRYRFSFGMEGFEDVAADPERQDWAGRLCDAIFPESAALTCNEPLLELLRQALGSEPAFVERIVYFNAPNGGAQMHHDVERGHAGVAYAQLSGQTFWLALSKPELMREIRAFVADNPDEIERLLPAASDRRTLADLLADDVALFTYMEEQDHELIEAVMDRSARFVGHLVRGGFAHILQPGDVLLMPQRDLENCVWHSVFCLGDAPGEGLSFALRPARGDR